jgi:hypothetical protein
MIINDIKGSKANPVGKCIMHEIHAPCYIRLNLPDKGIYYSGWQTFLVLSTQVQTHTSINTIDFLVIPLKVQVS